MSADARTLCICRCPLLLLLGVGHHSQVQHCRCRRRVLRRQSVRVIPSTPVSADCRGLRVRVSVSMLVSASASMFVLSCLGVRVCLCVCLRSTPTGSLRTSICRAITSARLRGAFEGLFELCFFTLGGVAVASAAGDAFGGAGFGVEFVVEGAGGFPFATIEASVGVGTEVADAGAEEEVETDDVDAAAGVGVVGAATCFGRGGAVTMEAHLCNNVSAVPKT